MTRVQLQLRLKTPKKTRRRSQLPPPYEQSLANGRPATVSMAIEACSGAEEAADTPRISREVGGRVCEHDDGEEEDESYSADEDSFESEGSEEYGEGAADAGVDGAGSLMDSSATEGRSKERVAVLDEEYEDKCIDIQGDACKDAVGDSCSTRSNSRRAGGRGRGRQSSCYYDENTYTAISRLRAVNKRLTHQLEQQNKLMQRVNEEKKQHLQMIDTLHADVEMYKQALRALHNTTSGTAVAKNQRLEPALPRVLASAGSSRVVTKPRPPRQSPRFGQEIGRDDRSYPSSPSSASSICRRPLRSPSGSSPRKSSNLKATIMSTAEAGSLHAAGCSHAGHGHVQDVHLLEKLTAKLEKVEEERKEQQTRHTHQLSNYSHELSRLERQLDQAHCMVQEKDNELRLQRTRQLYCSTPVAPSGVAGVGTVALAHRGSITAVGGGPRRNNTAGHRDSLQLQNIFSDDIWKGLLPIPTEFSATDDSEKTNHTRGVLTVAPAPSIPAPFTSHVGQAFQQLLGHQLSSFHDHALDHSTREWLLEVRTCGAQMLALHHSLQSMARSLQRLAESTHTYELAEALTGECHELLQAEQTLVLVVHKSEQEFWCRLPAPRPVADDGTEIKATDGGKPLRTTVRSALLPLVTSTGFPEHGDGSDVSATVPCGLASLVYHTKRPLLLPAGHMTRHSSYSQAMDNSDRLVAHPSASTLLVPVLHDNRVLAVVQVCGKLTQVEALGLSIALEKSDTFSPEDQALLTLLCHFSSGLFPKVAYFTDVESNKVNEETLIELVPEIFTCLRFDELGKVVIENAKNILDADRCSLFVADNAARTLHNWHSDISGAGVEVFQRSASQQLSGEASKAGGMTIHFGHGIVGLVAETLQSINIPDAYDDPRFNSAWDQKTHYRTKSMLTMPILSNARAAEKPVTRRASASGNGPQEFTQSGTSKPQQPMEQKLLGVVQVINKSGGAPFRAKDEFLLHTISKLIALAIDNSQLFQKNQELCWNVGKLIADGDMVEAVVSLGVAAEQIIGVEGAAVYVVDPTTKELVTFHHKRRHRIVLAESTYHGSLLDEAVRSQQLLIVNDLSTAPQYNAFIDSLNGLTARNVLFAPLLIEEPECGISGIGSSSVTGCLPSSLSTGDSGQKLVGLLQLVNTKGRKLRFDPNDLFLSIVQSQSCSVLASILEKQRMLRQKEQIALLLDASMSLFKEMSVVGVINAVYNACTNIFDHDTTAHLYLWEDSGHPSDRERERHMWTSKVASDAAPSAAGRSSPSNATPSSPRVAADSSGRSAISFKSSLGTQVRQLSVLMDQTLRAPTSEGLFHQVLMRSSAVIVKNWVVEEEEEADTQPDAVRDSSRRQSRSRRASAARRRTPLDAYTLLATRSDTRLGFTRHAVVACPVWHSNGLEVAGVLVLLFPPNHAAVTAGVRSEELSTLPILTRQISGALSVCHDLSTVSSRAQKLQGMLELSRKAPRAAVSLTLTGRGHLTAFSQPVNVCSRAFSTLALTGELHASAAANLSVHALHMDEEGHRWGFQLSGASAHEMSSEHYAHWIGKSVATPVGCTEAQVFGKLRMDLQSVFVRKEVLTGVIDTRPHGNGKDQDQHAGDSNARRENNGDQSAPAFDFASELPRAVRLKIRQLLWTFVDASWQVDVARASRALFGASIGHGRSAEEDEEDGRLLLSRLEMERTLGTEPGGAGVSMTRSEWDALHVCFADSASGTVDVEAMMTTLRPQVKPFPVTAYELVPVLDTVTQAIVSVQVLLTATTR